MSLDLKTLPFANDLPKGLSAGFSQADCVVEPSLVDHALDQLAVQMTVALQAHNPVLLSVLHGGLYFTGQLMRRVVFPLQQGYVHVSRYRDETEGGELQWHGYSFPPLAGRTVILVDDVLDRGITLAALQEWALQQNAAEVYLSVLVDKGIQPRPVDADFVALECPDRFLFGCGMDLQGYGRNLPGIYALAET